MNESVRKEIRNAGNKSEEWEFKGTHWELFNLIRFACVAYELHIQDRSRIIQLLSDKTEYEKAALELGITYDAIKKELRRNLDAAEWIDPIIDNAISQK